VTINPEDEMPDDLKPDDVRTMAAEIGLTKFSSEHLEQLTRATKAARARRANLRAETLQPADEPAHVLRLGPEVVR
jgi:hypothetical protein